MVLLGRLYTRPDKPIGNSKIADVRSPKLLKTDGQKDGQTDTSHNVVSMYISMQTTHGWLVYGSYTPHDSSTLLSHQ